MHTIKSMIEPTNVVALFDLAYLHTTQENYDDAIVLYKVLSINPTIYDALCNMAHKSCATKGLVHEAIPIINNCCKKPSPSPCALWFG